MARAPPTRSWCYFYSLRIAWPPPQGEAVRTPSFSTGYDLNLGVRSSFSFFLTAARGVAELVLALGQVGTWIP